MPFVVEIQHLVGEGVSSTLYILEHTLTRHVHPDTKRSFVRSYFKYGPGDAQEFATEGEANKAAERFQAEHQGLQTNVCELPPPTKKRFLRFKR